MCYVATIDIETSMSIFAKFVTAFGEILSIHRPTKHTQKFKELKYFNLVQKALGKLQG